MKRLDSLCTQLAKLKWVLPLALALTPLIVGQVMAQESAPTAAAEPSEEVQACMGCHDPEAESATAVHFAVLQNSPHKDSDCTSCHTEFTADEEHTEAMLASKVDCSSCHDEAAEAFSASIHGGTPQKEGDLPTCITCHSQTSEDPHAVVAVADRSRTDKVGMCSSCHADVEKMGRYGVDPDAVSSYETSFHGKALLRFGSQKTAACSDCHTAHAVFKSTDPKSSVHSNNVPNTCGQANCHPGASMNFAMSGAGHMNLKIERDPGLNLILLFFKVLVIGMTSFLMIGVGLDMRRAIFGKTAPESGRFIGVVIALGFLSIVAAILQATFEVPNATQTALAGVLVLILSMALNRIFGPKREKHAEGKTYPRLSLALRWQHGLLAVAFMLLVVTGIPVRQAEDDILRGVYMAMGGLEVGRWIHRAAGVMLMGVFLWHIAGLLVQWRRAGFKFSSWTMLPRRKDVTDFVDTSKYYLGTAPAGPKFDRFNFREKMDYFAEYWGIPLMGITGLILWYPVAATNIFHGNVIPAAYIAHSYEAVLAFLAILTWHMYNTHFNPYVFPMNKVWYTGYLSEEEMAREHPLELERLKAAEAPVETPEETPVTPADTEAAPDPESEPESDSPPDEK